MIKFFQISSISIEKFGGKASEAKQLCPQSIIDPIDFENQRFIAIFWYIPKIVPHTIRFFAFFKQNI